MGVGLFLAVLFNFLSSAKGASPSVIDPVILEESAMQVMESHCFSCHGPKKQNGKLRLDTLETNDPVDLQELFAKMSEVVQFNEMPPEEAKQPNQTERKILLQWLGQQLNGKAANALAEKLQRFEYGNVISHQDLFSGKYAGIPSYTFDRRWLISEFIFNEKINRLLNYNPTRTVYGNTQPVQGDSGVHWSPKTERGNKFRRTITNPYLLPQKVGVRYSSHESLTTGHLLTMLGNAKRVAGYMSSEDTMKAQYPAMYLLMQTQLDHREIVRSRERFLRTYSFMERLLTDIYGKEHDKLLPQFKAQDIPFPGPPEHSTNGIQKRHQNLDFLGRFNREDIDAILQGITTYKKAEFKVNEIPAESLSDLKGNPVWVPYTEADRAEFEKIILLCERDWFREGVTDYRIQNRIMTMKLFYDTWDMNRLYLHIKNGSFIIPKYKPLNVTEMSVITDTIKAHRKPGDTHNEIIDKCLTEWNESLKAERESAGGTDQGLMSQFIDEMYVEIFERKPTDLELAENIGQFK